MTNDFAARLRSAAAEPLAIVDADTGAVIARRVEAALTRSSRRRGLLSRDSLAESTALALAPCAAVHTVGMRFTIDVLFLSRRGRVLKMVSQLRPWRIAGRLGAYATIELAAGTLQSCRVKVGDRLALEPRTGASAA